MDLLVFDLDGTLLNGDSQISAYTANTLSSLRKAGIAYTVATGRTMSSAEELIAGYGFDLPHIYSNGVITWDPRDNSFLLDNLLSHDEATFVLETTVTQQVAAFVSAIDSNHQHYIFYAPIRHEAERKLLATLSHRPMLKVMPLADIPDDISVTNISMIGDGDEVDTIHRHVNTQTHLIAYSGPAIEGQGLKWMDIHHNAANKGSALTMLRQRLNVERIICFGDSDNDLSMFAMADESYAPENAHPHLREAATAVIGRNTDDGVARYLRERFL